MPSDYGTYRVFISSSMEELAEERQVVEKIIEAVGYQPFVYERDAGARPWNHEQTFVRELKKSNLYVGIFWNKYGEFTRQEFDLAKERGIPRLLFEKVSRSGSRDQKLQEFLDHYNRVTQPDGLTIARFTSPAELKKTFSDSFKKFLGEMAIRGSATKWKATSDENTVSSKDLLPCLCNRDKQEVNLLDSLSLIKLPTTERPFLWVLPGPSNEEHWLYVKRIKEYSLKKYFPPRGDRIPFQVVTLRQPLTLLSTPERLRGAIFQECSVDITGNDEMLISKLKKKAVKFLLVDVKLKDTECNGKFMEHIKAVAQYLSKFPKLPTGFRMGIMVSLVIENERTKYLGWRKFVQLFSKEMEKDISIQGTIKECQRLYEGAKELHFKNLEMLFPATTEDVSEWCKREEVQKHVGVLLKDKIHHHIFKPHTHLPMRDLYRKLSDLLDGCLNVG
ncbi:MAG: DUF4062 domain-containing protein [Nitrospira sp.]|nr:DUF4062 domain-containing protein [Nitrospira sp.]